MDGLAEAQLFRLVMVFATSFSAQRKTRSAILMDLLYSSLLTGSAMPGYRVTTATG